jgi:myo-inositol-1(or 4)-monophosphatase
MQAQLNVAANAALKSGKVLMQYFSQRERLKFITGKDGNLITSAHSNIEEIILEELSKNYPEYTINAKESGEFRGNEFSWYVNAIDGTENFIHGIPNFAINISLIVNNEVKLGVIYDPTKDELYTAAKGQGATLNQSRVRIFKKTSPVLLIASDSNNIIKDSSYRVSGCQSLDLAYVSSSKLSGIISSSCDIWNSPAGILMIREAGGFILNEKNHDVSFTNNFIKAGSYKVAKGL